MSDALLEAIQSRDVDRLADILAGGADPNVHCSSRHGTTPLQAAIVELETESEDEPGGPVDAVVLLLRHGARVNDWDERHRFTPIFTAVQINHIEAVRILLAAGADPNVSDDEGYSPLIVCAEQGYLNLARLLLHCGAAKSIDAWGGPSSLTALGYAARELHVEMVRLLLAHGADPQECDLDHLTALECLGYAESPDDPANQERIREIRQMLGAPESTDPTS